jgi:molecular chaperone GrpE
MLRELDFAIRKLISGGSFSFRRLIMNDSKNDSKKADPAATNQDGSPSDAGAVPAGPAAQPPAGEQAPAGEPDPFVVLENLQLENAALKHKVLRVLAEMENQRRRAEREVADAKTYGVTSFARDMLTFADNLRRAVESVPPEAREQEGAALKTLIEGVELTERDFLSRLGKNGVKKLEPLGAKFDPNLHEALFEAPDETAPNGTVVQVVDDGYAIGDRVLRPAKVGVSRGAPEPAS